MSKRFLRVRTWLFQGPGPWCRLDRINLEGTMKVRIPIVLILFATLATVAFGQATNSADIRGTVTDSSGAVILGASITVKDVDKGDQHVFTTDGAGIYDTGPLVPDDRYRSEEHTSELQSPM